MFISTFIPFSSAALICFTLVHANWFEDNVLLRQSYDGRIPRRQIDPAVSPLPAAKNVALGTGVIVPAEITTTSSSAAKTVPTTSPTTQPPQTSPTDPAIATTTDAPPETQSSNPTTSNGPADTPSSTQQPVTPGTTSRSSATTIVKPSSTVSQSVELVTSIITVSGSVMTTVSSSTTEVPVSQPTEDEPSQDKGSNSSGMSSKTKNTVIGVVVGIGGTALLAGLAIVAWRIWGRKKDADEDHGLMDFRNSSPGHEKAVGGGNLRSANPFQSTLENYHNPTRVNASSNF